MVEITDDLLCLFSAAIEERQGSYVIEVPKREVTAGAVRRDGTYRVALCPAVADGDAEATADRPLDERPDGTHDRGSHDQEPPVSEGEQRTVDIEALGEQGDGIARVERGFVVIVPETEEGERVTIEITDVTENVAFGTVIGREAYYE